MDMIISYGIIFENCLDFKFKILFIAIGLYDESSQRLNLNHFNLKFLEKKIEKQYAVDQQHSSIKNSKIIFGLLLLLFAIYVLTKFVNSQKSNFKDFFPLIMLIFGIFSLVFMITSLKYSKYHYKFIEIILWVCIFIKIVFDWAYSDYNKNLSGVLVPIFSCLTIYLRMSFTCIFYSNLIYLMSYIMRLLICLKNHVLNVFQRVILFFDDMSSFADLRNNDTFEHHVESIRFSITLYLIVTMVLICFICLAITYEEEKQKRFEFLVKNKINFESKLVQDILAMLVPKFIKSIMVQGMNNCINITFN